MSDRSLRILMVEDNAADVLIVEEVLDALEVPTRLTSVPSGQEALALLRGSGSSASSPRPDVVWLDLKLPGLNGHEVLQQIREDPELTDLPVVILSSSNSRDDVERAYAAHANCYCVKSLDFSSYSAALGALVELWARHAQLPSRVHKHP